MQKIVDENTFRKQNKKHRLRQHLHPVEICVRHLPKVVIKDSAVKTVANGANVYSSGITKLTEDIDEGKITAIMTLKGELVGTGKAINDSETIYSEKCEAVEIDSVYMKPETYSRDQKHN